MYDTTAQTIVIEIKSHCARYGIPDEITSDNGPHIISYTMSKFTRKCGTNQKTISPQNSKANDNVESPVKTAKNMLRKTEHGGEDQYLPLLNIRNTPTQGTTTSPAQRMCRRTKTIVPIVVSLLKPNSKAGENEVDKLKKNYRINRSPITMLRLMTSLNYIKVTVSGFNHSSMVIRDGKRVITRQLDVR